MAAGASVARTTEIQLAPVGKAAESENEDERRWRPVLALPCDLMVELPLPAFKISDLLQLRPGSIANAHWRVGHDIPLRLNGTLIGWVEFEIMGNNLAVRLTELV
jgi:flagellar motor switch/type III secretory pathway protein FliN